MSYYLNSEDKILWQKGYLSLSGIEEAIKRQDPDTGAYIIKTVLLDPKPKNWFLVNDTNDDIKNSNYTERTDDEMYDAKSVHAHETIADALSVLCNKSEMQRQMKDVYVQKHKLDDDFDFSFSHFPSIKRDSIRKIYATIAQEQWDKISNLDSKLVPDRLKLDNVLIDLYEMTTPFARNTIMEVLENVPFSYGVWHGIKSIYRKSIEIGDWEIFASITTRIENIINQYTTSVASNRYRCRYNNEYYEDSHNFWGEEYNCREIHVQSLRWISRNSWRVLRKIAKSQPELYVPIACEILRQTTVNVKSHWYMNSCWVLTHIMYGESLTYSMNRKGLSSFDMNINQRKFLDLWGQDIEPIKNLALQATSFSVVAKAIEFLKTDFKNALFQLSTTYINALIRSEDRNKIQFAYEIIHTYSGPQKDFSKKGLDQSILLLMRTSTDHEIKTYCSDYIRNNKSTLINSIDAIDIVSFSSTNADLVVDLLTEERYIGKLSLENWCEIHNNLGDDEFIDNFVPTILQLIDGDRSWYSKALSNDSHNALSYYVLTTTNFEEEEFIEILEHCFQNPLCHASYEDLICLGTEFEAFDSENPFFESLSKESNRVLFLANCNYMSYLSTYTEENEAINLSILGIDFLQMIYEPDVWNNLNWTNYLGEAGTKLLDLFKNNVFTAPQDSSDDVQFSLSSSDYEYDEEIASILMDSTVEELTVDWLLSKIRDERTNYDFVRTYANSNLPLSQWSYKGKKGHTAILQEFQATTLKDTKQYLLRFIKSRCNSARLLAGKNAVAEDFEFTLPEWRSNDKKEITVSSLLRDNNNKHRSLGIFFAKNGLQTYSQSLSFEALLDLFESPHADVQNFFISSVEDSGEGYGYLDFRQKADDGKTDLFTMGGLRNYLSSANPKIRDIAIRIIQLYPDMFGKLEDLLHLVGSKDRRIRELVVQQIWKQYKDRGLTLHWKPFEESRVRQLPTARRRVNVRTTSRGGITHVQDQKSTEWTIGEGLSPKEHVSIQFENITEFVRCILFRLPPKTPRSALANRLLDVVPATKNKIYLIESLVDLARQEVEFANSLYGILHELQSSDGKMEREAVLVGIQKIQKVHGNLSEAK